MKNLKKLYSLSICFVSALLLLISFTISMVNVLDLMLPQYRHKSQFTKFSSTEKFISSNGEKEKKRLQSLGQENLIREMKLARESSIERIRDRAIENLLLYVVMVVVGMVFWIIHWKMYKFDMS